MASGSRLQEELSQDDTSADSEDAADGGGGAGTSVAGDGGRLGGLGRAAGDDGDGGVTSAAAARGALGGRGSGGSKGGLDVGGGGLLVSGGGGGSGRRGLGGGVSGRRGLGGGSLGGGGGSNILAVVAAVAEDDLDALPGAAVVAVDVLLDALGGGGIGTGVVDNGDALVVAQEGSLGEIGVATGPLDGALRSVLAAGDPGSELDLHGRLGETIGAALGVGSGQGADNVVVDQPGDTGRSPLHGVGVERSQRVVDGVESTTVVGGSVALAEVVGLSLGVVTANPFPVDLRSHELVFLSKEKR